MSSAKLRKQIKNVLAAIQVVFYRLFISKPDIFISFGISAGDDLLCTIIAQQLRRKGYKKIWIGTGFPEIFLNNPHVDKALKQNEHGHISLFFRKYLQAIKVNHIHPWYTVHNKITDQDIIPDKHIIYKMCDKVNVAYPEQLRPNIYLSEREKLQGKLSDNQVCIQSTGSGARQYMQTKDWLPERFVEVVSELLKDYTVIQIGSLNDQLLPGVIDMRGKTSIREAAAILYHSQFFVGLVGFLMHLARSVNCRSVIIYGGRERPDQSGYEENINLYSAVPCSPCWYWNYCPNDKICMKAITAEDVLAGIKQLVNSEITVA